MKRKDLDYILKNSFNEDIVRARDFLGDTSGSFQTRKSSRFGESIFGVPLLQAAAVIVLVFISYLGFQLEREKPSPLTSLWIELDREYDWGERVGNGLSRKWNLMVKILNQEESNIVTYHRCTNGWRYLKP